MLGKEDNSKEERLSLKEKAIKKIEEEEILDNEENLKELEETVDNLMN